MLKPILTYFIASSSWFTDQYDQMAKEHRQMQLDHYQLREKYDDLVEKMKFFTKVVCHVNT